MVQKAQKQARSKLGMAAVILCGLAVAAILTLVEIARKSPAAFAATDPVWDPAVLRVPWAADFYPIAANQINVRTDSRLPERAAGDGIADDAPAINAAIRLASSSGGGTVYFPPGDYKIVAPSDLPKGKPLLVPSRVILRGSGPMTSRVFVNDPDAAKQTDYIGTWGGIDFRGSSLTGMTDLGIFAVSSSTSQCAAVWNRSPIHVSELFFNNLDVHLANCRAFWMETVDKLVVQNSRFDTSAEKSGPVYFVSDSNFVFINNNITYRFGRVQLQNDSNLLMQNNTVVRDAQSEGEDNGPAIESGGIELSFAQSVQILDNTIETLNPPPDEFRDGEGITTQHSSTPDILDAGSTTGISSANLTDSGALWDADTLKKFDRFPGTVVVMFTGRAAGEVRAIRSINTSAKILNLTEPWNPEPEIGAHYSMLRWSFQNATIAGNKLINNPAGIVLWDGCYKCTITNNTLDNSRGIILRAVDQLMLPSTRYYTYEPETRRVHQISMDVTITDNVLTNSSGLRPAFIALDVEAVAPENYRGVGMMNIIVQGNTIHPFSTNPSQSYDPKHNQLSQDGFFPCYYFGPATAKDPIETVFRNITFVNNNLGTNVTYSPGFAPYTAKACVAAAVPPTNVRARDAL